MNLWQAFKMAFKSISMKKTRSFLTMLGIIIGVASVVIMVSVVQGQNRQTMETVSYTHLAPTWAACWWCGEASPRRCC